MRILRGAIPPLAALLLFLVACRRLIRWRLEHPGDTQGTLLGFHYTHSVLAPNYLANGFIRRGLPGTIMALIDGRHTPVSGASFHLFSALWLGIAVAFLLRKVAAVDLRAAAWLAIVLVASPQFAFWGGDVARTDLFTSGFVVWTCVAALDRRWMLASALLALGNLAHETVVIMGAPLLVALWYLDYRERRDRVRPIVVALALLGVLLVATALLQRALAPSGAELVATIAAGSPPDPFRDMAAYMAIGGARMLQTSACMARASPGHPLFIASGFLVLPLYGPLLGFGRSRLHVAFFLFTAFLPLLFLSVVAIDYGRWLIMAAFNAWLAAAALTARSPAETQRPRPRRRLAGPILALLLAMGQAGVFSANRATELLATKIWAEPRIDAVTAIDRCEPGWREMARLGSVP